jgi:hypothetical protein
MKEMKIQKWGDDLIARKHVLKQRANNGLTKGSNGYQEG